jgi:hypothetical protein
MSTHGAPHFVFRQSLQPVQPRTWSARPVCESSTTETVQTSPDSGHFTRRALVCRFRPTEAMVMAMATATKSITANITIGDQCGSTMRIVATSEPSWDDAAPTSAFARG